MRTIVGFFNNQPDAANAVDDLIMEGFRSEDIDYISRDTRKSKDTDQSHVEMIEPEDTGDSASTGASVGAVMGTFAGMLLGLGALTIPGIGPVLAVGPLVATLTGAGVGALAGGLIGALVDSGIPEEHALFYSEGIRRGGALVILRTSEEQVNQALLVLNRHHPIGINRQAIDWRKGNWESFDNPAEPMQEIDQQYDHSTLTSQADLSERFNDISDMVNEDETQVPVTGHPINQNIEDLHEIDYGDLADEDANLPQTRAKKENDSDEDREIE